MIVIEINERDVLEKTREEISKVAASAYDGDGQSLYDSIIVYSRDADDMKRLFTDALSRLTERSRDILSSITYSYIKQCYKVDMNFVETGEVKPYYFVESPPDTTQMFSDADGVPYAGGPVSVVYDDENNIYNIQFMTEPNLLLDPPTAGIVATGSFAGDSDKVELYYPHKLEYNLPDFNAALLPMVSADVVRFLTQHITAQWLVGKRYQRAEEFVAHANVVLEETIHHLKIRKPVNQRIQL